LDAPNPRRQVQDAVKFLQSEIARWTRLIEQAGIRAD